MKKHIITIGGRPGSGKSTTARALAEVLGYKRFSSGGFMRTLAQERNMTLAELNELAETQPWVDSMIDEKLRALGDTEQDIIIDSRLAFYWIPDAFKVYLDLPIEESARRIFADTNAERGASGESHGSVEETLTSIERRLASERKRYKERYDVDPYDGSQFDLVIDTSHTTPPEVSERIAEAYKTWLTS